MINNAIHILDCLLYLVESKVTEVSSHCATLNSDLEVEDSIVMWLTFDNGAIATVNSSYCVPGIHPLGLTECRIWGVDGHISLTPPYQFFSSRLIDGKRPERWHKNRV